jgi:hypothetical protein
MKAVEFVIVSLVLLFVGSSLLSCLARNNYTYFVPKNDWSTGRRRAAQRWSTPEKIQQKGVLI